MSGTRDMSKRTFFINRFIWAALILGALTGAWFSGERLLYLFAVVLLALPAASFIIAFFLLRGLKVSREQPVFVLKNRTETFLVGLHNATFMPLGSVEVLINADENAVNVLENQTVPLNPFGKRRLEIPFQIEYRGHYEFGLGAVQITDITGLFKLRRKFDANKTITSLPHVRDLSNFPLTMNLMTQASSRFDIRDEDYSIISDIRQYLPTDSIKRVHWKLTAKRNEWLVKNFQSNALNRVLIILDSTRLPLQPREMYALEDSIVENALGLTKFCLGKAMPVDFLTTEGQKVSAQTAEFDLIYQAASELRFTTDTALNCNSILSHALNDATGYVNAVIITARLDTALYKRIVNEANNGHYIAVLYFSPPQPDEVSTEIFNLLNEGGMPCFSMN